MTMAEAIKFSPRELYGGAIVANLPQDFIDSSDLREIPDHQEVFLSPTTLTSVIFEINLYQTASDIRTPQNVTLPATATEDERASTHHILDPVAPPDQIDPNTMTFPPNRVSLPHPSVTKYPAYLQAGTIQSPEIDRAAKSVLPVEWAQNPTQKIDETRCFQLLVRLQDHETDICVRLYVPLKEFQGAENQGRKAEELAFGEAVIEEIVKSFQIKNFGLFG